LDFKARISLVQLAGHAVELIGELFQLVAGRDVDAMAEVAGAETPCARAQRCDRNQHPARQQCAGQDRNREPKPDQQGDPHQLIADRRQRQRRRLLEQHEPAELRRHGRRGQYRMAVAIGARRARLAVRLDQAATCGSAERSLATSGPLAELAITVPLGSTT
jgi:hypothetical protein